LEIQTSNSDTTHEKYKGLQKWGKMVMDIHKQLVDKSTTL
jgi:hypothetical protein